MNESKRKNDFFGTLRQDFRELKEYFLSESQKSRLEGMSKLKQSLYLTGWLIKILYQKLTRVRQILLIVGIAALFIGNNSGNSSHLIGGAILLFIIMLEIKDKLLARDELLAGRAVQNALLPERSPVIPGWDVWLFTRPANDVGGDLVDYMKINENRFGFSLGDVAGKGLAAALFMAKLQATIRAIAPDYSSLAELAQKINRIFCRDGLPNRFASLIYLELKAGENTVRLINAGHLPPLPVENGVIGEMQKGGPALGLMKNAEYSEKALSLEPGNLLFIYSDGLTEARNEKGEFYGLHYVKEILSSTNHLSAAEVGEKIVTKVDRFIGDAQRYDDLSLMVLKRI
ncbi:MAG TPA: serine/threonine-protein phosphatase [Bacteroidetes bacterium]|nr:serine/threonine-protein phosphatase [Bacteroidota bacterium]